MPPATSARRPGGGSTPTRNRRRPSGTRRPEHRFEGAAHGVAIEWLRQEGDPASLDERSQVRVEHVAAHEHETPVELRTHGDDRVEHLGARHARHAVIAQHGIEFDLADELDGRIAAGRHRRLVARRSQPSLEEHPDRAFVVQHEDVDGRRRGRRWRFGRSFTDRGGSDRQRQADRCSVGGASQGPAVARHECARDLPRELASRVDVASAPSWLIVIRTAPRSGRAAIVSRPGVDPAEATSSASWRTLTRTSWICARSISTGGRSSGISIRISSGLDASR